MTDPLFLTRPGGLAGIAAGDVASVEGDEARHAVAVRRIRVGERVMLADGAGAGVRGEVVEATRERLGVRVGELLQAPPAPVRWVVAQALAKGERSDLAVEILTEVGVGEVLAWQAARSVVRWEAKADKGVAKWAATAREAAKQSRRLTVPAVGYARTAEVADRIARADLALVLHEDATDDIAAVTPPDHGEVVLVVGPEGGIAPEELGAFRDAGARAVRISDAVLRASTAGAIALAQLDLLEKIAR